MGTRLSGGVSERIGTRLEVGMMHAWGPGIKNFKWRSAEQEMLGTQMSLVGGGGLFVTYTTSEHSGEVKRFLESQDMESPTS